MNSLHNRQENLAYCKWLFVINYPSFAIMSALVSLLLISTPCSFASDTKSAFNIDLRSTEGFAASAFLAAGFSATTGASVVVSAFLAVGFSATTGASVVVSAFLSAGFFLAIDALT